MNIKLISSTLLLVLTGLPVYAKAGSGAHGGDAIVCELGNGTRTVEVLDYFEATQFGNKLELGDASLSPQDMAKHAIKRIETLDPVAYKKYNSWIDSFFSEARLLDRSYIPDIDDARSVVVPAANCYKLQFAVQFRDPAEFAPRYLIDKYLWDRASSIQRAGLILHEVIYRDAIGGKNMPDNSDGVRYYNAVLSSDSLSESTKLVKYLRVLQRAGLGSGAFQRSRQICDVDVQIPNVELNPDDGCVASGVLSRPQKGLSSLYPDVAFAGAVKFYPYNYLQSAQPVDQIWIRNVPVKFESVDFDLHSGNITKAKFPQSSNPQLNISPIGNLAPALVAVSWLWEVEFYGNGVPKNVHAVQQCVPVFVRGYSSPIQTTCDKYLDLYFNQDGYLRDDSFHYDPPRRVSFSYLSRPGITVSVEANMSYIEKDSDSNLSALSALSVSDTCFPTLELYGSQIEGCNLVKIKFHPNSAIRSLTVRPKTQAKLLCQDGKTWKKIKAPSNEGMNIDFDDQSLMICSEDIPGENQ